MKHEFDNVTEKINGIVLLESSKASPIRPSVKRRMPVRALGCYDG
jgi:hypothetical protein